MSLQAEHLPLTWLPPSRLCLHWQMTQEGKSLPAVRIVNTTRPTAARDILSGGSGWARAESRGGTAGLARSQQQEAGAHSGPLLKAQVLPALPDQGYRSSLGHRLACLPLKHPWSPLHWAKAIGTGHVASGPTELKEAVSPGTPQKDPPGMGDRGRPRAISLI